VLDARRALRRQIVLVRCDADAPEVEAVGVPAALNGGVGADLATAVVADGLRQAVELCGFELEENAL
jgi:Zn-dependent alcohol dehydrogenase